MLSWIPAGDFTWPQSVTWNTLICVLLLACTHFLWSRWTSRAHRPPAGTITGAVTSGHDSWNSKNDGGSARKDTDSGAGGSGNTSDRAPRRQKKMGNSRRGDAQMPAVKKKMPKLDYRDYTVGWLCAIGTEYVVAQAFLDEKHEAPEFVPNNDDNDYTLGRVGKHNVVIVILPEYGIAAAASVAKDLSRSFPNIRIGLMVGIGGGAPSRQHDIRLGDVVVSAPSKGYGGVFQYDFGKTIQNGAFHTTGFLNQPPAFLRAAVLGLKAEYESEGHQLEEAIDSVLKQHPRLRQKYQRPQPSTDRLYHAEVIHPPNSDENCAICCGDGSDQSRVVLRHDRTEYEDNPTIHHGLIASANQVMKDATIRDKLIKEKNVMCFEMEAAGLMNQFPCLVIRGICDYADSHKSKEWQGYSAMAAAAYAKDLLCRIPPSSVEAEKRISDVLTGLEEVVTEQLESTEELVRVQKDFAKERLSDKEEQCHQVFRVKTGSADATYEWYKDRVEDRVDGTCQWFLQHDNFQEWLQKDFGPLLVSADPGCGKSVLTKYLIDHGLPRSSTICYFFFKEQDQNKVHQALCALLHQLFSQKPFLIRHAMPQFRKDGQELINSTQSLWTIFEDAVGDPQAGPVILVLDALDECAQPDFENLVRNIKSHFNNNHAGGAKVKYLLTSRPYENIVSQFRDRNLLKAFPNIRIPGEEESETISQEVNRVIAHRVNQLSEKKKLSSEIRNRLEVKLQGTTHRTYLWVYLVFDYLEKENFKKTVKGIESTFKALPKSINEAYEQILNKSRDEERPIVRKALSIILAAARPLTISEMNVAINMNSSVESIHDIDLENEEDFKTRLRSWCGLFVSIYQGCIYFLHQTVREFLLADLASPTIILSEPCWRHSITIQYAHTVLAEACVPYLNLFNSDDLFETMANGEARCSMDAGVFLVYAAERWGLHLREAGSIADNAAIISAALSICNPNLSMYTAWFGMYWRTTGQYATSFASELMVASYFGLSIITRLLLEKGANTETRDTSYHRTPLSWAAELGHAAIVQMLLENGAGVETRCRSGRTPLLWAAERGRTDVVKMLLAKGAIIETKCFGGWTPLFWAIGWQHESVVRLLLENGADIEAKDNYGQTPLWRAVERGSEAIVKLLLDRRAQVDIRDNGYNPTPLLLAAARGRAAIVQMLLDSGAELEAKGNYDQAPLLWAAESGHTAVVKILLDNGAQLETKDNYGQTPLLRATKNGYAAVIEILLANGANIETKCFDGWTPLLWAIGREHEDVVRLLLGSGADIEAKGNYGRTPLWWASERGNRAIVKLLLDRGAQVETQDTKCNRTPLSWAVERGDVGIVNMLLEKSAGVNSRDNNGWTPLLWAAQRGHKTIVKMLLEKGPEVEAKDNKYGGTALSWAAQAGHASIVKMLFERSAEVDSKDKDGRTPLLWAAQNGHEAIVRMLLEKGPEVEAKDNKYGGTALSWAAQAGHASIVKMLFERGAEVDSKDKDGRTPLLWAAQNGHEAIVKMLLMENVEVDVNTKNGQTPLLGAAHGGYTAIVGMLLETGVEVDAKDDKGRTSLYWAAKNGHEAIVNMLLENCAGVDMKDHESKTPLLAAAGNGHGVIAQMLLEKGAGVDVTNIYGCTPLLWAIQKGQKDIVKILLDNLAEVNIKDSYGWTPLLLAAQKGHDATVKMLLENHAEVNVKGRKGETPLFWAARKGYRAIAEMLLEKGAELDVTDNYGCTPLWWSTYFGHTAIINMLLEKNAGFEIADNEGQTPLLVSAERGDSRITELLLEIGANIEAKDLENRTPLLLASQNGQDEVVALLLEKGANIEAKSLDGRTALFHATEGGHYKTVIALVAQGIGLNTKDGSSLTALELASFNLHDNIEQFLLSSGSFMSPDFYGLGNLFSTEDDPPTI